MLKAGTKHPLKYFRNKKNPHLISGAGFML